VIFAPGAHYRGMKIISLTALAAASGLVALPAVAPAKGGGTRVVKSGTCSDGSHWKLKVKPDDNVLEVEFEVDMNRNGIPWKVTIRRNGSVAASGTRTTHAPSGSFSFERRISGSSGAKISATARRTSTGATCRGTATAP
jgi:hypothetical protein